MKLSNNKCVVLALASMPILLFQTDCILAQVMENDSAIESTINNEHGALSVEKQQVEGTAQPEVEPSPAIIYQISTDQIEVESGAVTSSFRLFGSKMTNAIQFKVYFNGQETQEVKIASIEGDKGGSRTITLQAPVNTSGADKVYQIAFGYGEVTPDSPSITLTVHPGEEVVQPEEPTQPEQELGIIYQVNTDQIEVESGAVTNSFRLFGSKMTDAVNMKAYLNGQETQDVKIASIEGDKGGSRTITLQAPVNTSGADKVYQVAFGYGEMTPDSPSITLIVHPGEEVVQPEESTQPEQEPGIIYQISTDQIEVESGAVTSSFRLFGSKMTDAINMKAYLNSQETQDVKIASIEGDKGGSRTIKLQAPVNTSGADKVYQVAFGYGEVTPDSPSITLIVHPGEEVVQPEEPSQPDDDKPVEDNKPTLPDDQPTKPIETDLEIGLGQPSVSLSKTRKAITFKFSEPIITIPNEDLLSFITYSTIDHPEPQLLPEGSRTILLGDTFGIFLPSEATENMTLHISKGLFAGQESKKTNDDWLIPITVQETKEAKINNYSFDQEVIPSTGGMVNITIMGENLINPSEDPINGTRIRIFDPSGIEVAQDIMDQVTYTGGGDQLIAHVPLPANQSDHSQSYRLTFYHQGNNVYQRYLDTNRGDRPALTVLTKDQASDQPSISYMTIASYAPSGTGSIDDQLDLTHTTVARNQRSKKTEVRIYGANLDEKVMDAYAVDQYGVKWPIVAGQLSQYPKRVLTGNSGIPNGFVGGGNFMIAEIILPNDYDEVLTFTYYFAPDGKNYDRIHTVSATVEPDDGHVTLQRKTVTLEFQELGSNKELKEKKIFEGYTFFDNPITSEKLDIEGYQLETDLTSFLKDSLGDLPDHLVLSYRPIEANADDQGPDDATDSTSQPIGTIEDIAKTTKVTRETIPGKVKYEADDSLEFEKQVVDKAPEDGEKEVTTVSQPGKEDVVTEEVTKEAVDGVTRVGNKKVETTQNEDGSTTTTTIYDVDPETGELTNPTTTTKTTMPASPIEDIAKPNEVYLAIFNGNGGSPATQKVTVKDGEVVSGVVEPTREGYKFVKWVKAGTDTELDLSKPFSKDLLDEDKTVMFTAVWDKEVSENGDSAIVYPIETHPIFKTVGDDLTEEEVTNAIVVLGLDRSQYTVTINEGQEVPSTDKAGDYIIDVTITYKDGTTEAAQVAIIITESDDAEAPAIDAGNVIAVEGQPIPPVMVDVDDPNASVKVEGLPEGLTYNPETKQIEGTVPKSDDWKDGEEVRELTATIIATNEEGKTTTKDITVTILRDTDGDGTPDATDTDDDNDGVGDITEDSEGTDPKDSESKPEIDDEDPSDDGKDPSDDGKDPSDDGKDPSDDGKDPSDDGKDPSDDGKDPSDEDSKPSKDDSKPSDEAENDGEESAKSLADQIDITLPEKTGVKDINNLTKIEKEKVKIAITDANKLPKGTEVLVGSKGDVIINFPDGSHIVIDGDKLVYQLADSETGKPADPDKGGAPSEPGTGDADKGSDDASDSKGGDKDSSKDKDSKGGDKGSSKDSKAKDSKDKLPQTGESSSAAILGLAGLSIMAGLGLVAGRRKEDN